MDSDGRRIALGPRKFMCIPRGYGTGTIRLSVKRGKEDGRAKGDDVESDLQ